MRTSTLVTWLLMRLIAFGVFLAIYPAQLSAQRIHVSENVVVAHGLESRPLIEPHLAADPRDSNALLSVVAVSNVAGSFSATQTCSTFASRDGGKTWNRHDFLIEGCGDPWVAIAPNGSAIFAALGAHVALA